MASIKEIYTWNDGTCWKMLQQILSRKTWNEFPILADAYQDAGGNETAAQFLRDPEGARRIFEQKDGWQMGPFLQYALKQLSMEYEENNFFRSRDAYAERHGIAHGSNNYDSGKTTLLNVHYTVYRTFDEEDRNGHVEDNFRFAEILQEQSGLPVTSLSLSWGTSRRGHRDPVSHTPDYSGLLSRMPDSMPMLQKLDISSTFYPIGNAEIARIGKLGKLEELTIGESRITDSGIEHFAGLGNIRRLSFRRNPELLTEKGIERLGQLLPRLYLLDIGLEDPVDRVREYSEIMTRNIQNSYEKGRFEEFFQFFIQGRPSSFSTGGGAWYKWTESHRAARRGDIAEKESSPEQEIMDKLGLEQKPGRPKN